MESEDEDDLDQETPAGNVELYGQNAIQDEDADAEGEEDIDQEQDQDPDGASGSDSSSGSDASDDDGSDRSDEDEDDDDEDGDMEVDETEESQSTLPNPEEKQNTRPPPISNENSPTPSLPPSLKRRTLFKPHFHADRQPVSLTLDPILSIPLATQTHSISISNCFSHILTGSQDGYIRSYDGWASANGGSLMTAHQRSVGGLGDSVTKGGVIRGWWSNENGQTEVIGESTGEGDVPAGSPIVEKLRDPVYSLACQREALWGLSGTSVGRINLFTIRHNIGRIHYSLAGHKRAVSGLALKDFEDGLFSIGWDGVAMEWDLNTGQLTRSFPQQNAQLSSIALQPLTSTSTPSGQSDTTLVNGSHPSSIGNVQKSSSKDMEDDYDPLFDDDVKLEADGAATKLSQIPQLSSESYSSFSKDVFMTSSFDGQITLWDRRVPNSEMIGGQGVGKLEMSDKTPPWCISAAWSHNGQLYAGRRNATVDVYDVRRTGKNTNGSPSLLKSLKNPTESGAVTCVVAFPDGNHMACASSDNVRLWATSHLLDAEPNSSAKSKSKSGAPFKIIAGHHGAPVSQMIVDPTCKFLVTASGNRGWAGQEEDSGQVILVHSIVPSY